MRAGANRTLRPYGPKSDARRRKERARGGAPLVPRKDAAVVESKRCIWRGKYKESRILGKNRSVKLQCAKSDTWLLALGGSFPQLSYGSSYAGSWRLGHGRRKKQFARLDLGSTVDLKCSELSTSEHGHRSVDRPLTGETVLRG